MNQSINQPANQLASQQVSQSVSLPASQSINQSINQSVISYDTGPWFLSLPSGGRLFQRMISDTHSQNVPFMENC